MGRLIVKLEEDSYVMWSTIADAPVTHLMTLEQLREHVRAWQGQEGLDALPARLERVERYGTSSLDGVTVDALLACNRAGSDEGRLTKAEIIDGYRADLSESVDR